MPDKVLLIDDDPVVKGLVRDALEGAGFDVEACATVDAGSRSFALARPNLVIVDMALPDGSGLDFCRKVGLGITIDTPFVFLTARDDLQGRLDAFAAGAHDYILKPFSVKELVARVQVQLQIKRLHDDLSRKNTELEMMNRARADVTDMIVHDLKNPLTSILGALDLVKARGLIPQGPQSKILDGANIAAQFMLLMVNDLLDVGRAEAAELKTELTPFDLEPLFDRVKRLFEARGTNRGVSLAVRVPPDVCRVTTDQILLFRILVNLVSNALRNASERSVVEIEAAREAAGVRVSVLDRGPGVPAELKSTIFEKYSSSRPKASGEGGGTGIGLTFCRLAVGALGGRVWCEDRPGGGSVFLVELPQT